MRFFRIAIIAAVPVRVGVLGLAAEACGLEAEPAPEEEEGAKVGTLGRAKAAAIAGASEYERGVAAVLRQIGRASGRDRV